MPSSAPTLKLAMCARRPLHIVDTERLDGEDMLVRFSDGSSAIYEAEELEKLRPVPKQMLPALTSLHPAPADPLPLAG